MTTASKLQVRPGHRVLVLGRPDGVDLGLGDAPAADDPGTADAVVAFVGARTDLDGPGFRAVVAAGRRDALTWVAYPKGGQRGTDLDRDVLAALMGERGLRPVRQASIDDTWSALRFRPLS
jgi:hypothetical protein